MKNLYLDTSRLRNLANDYKSEIWAPVDAFLRADRGILIISLAHFYDFTTRVAGIEDATATYLDSLNNLKWVPFPYDVFREELRVATEFALEGVTNSMTLFFDSFNDLLRYSEYKQLEKNRIIPNVLISSASLYDIHQPRTTSELIEYCAKYKVFDAFKKQLKTDATKITQWNKNTAIWQNPKMVLRSYVEAYLPKRTKHGKYVPKNAGFVDKLLDIAEKFMPSLVFTTALQRVKYGYENMLVEANDLVDEFHASFTPYCDVVLLDRGTCSRIKQTTFSYQNKVAEDPRDLFRILQI